jgi:hypothetical protein
MTAEAWGRRARLFVGIAAAAAIALILGFLALGGGDAEAERERRAPEPPAPPPRADQPTAPASAVAMASAASRAYREIVGKAESPRAAPEALEVVLTLQPDPNETALALTEESPLGLGRRSYLWGVIKDDGVAASKAVVEFVAGLNLGQKCETAHDGTYSFSQLYPGLGILQIALKGGRLARRELVIPNSDEAKFNCDLPRSADIRATLHDERSGTELGNAIVTLGEIPKETRLFGSEVEIKNVPEGKAMLYSIAPGFELRRDIVEIPGGPAGRPRDIELKLRRAARLRVEIDPMGDANTHGKVVILPVSSRVNTNFPFELGLFDVASGEKSLEIPLVAEGDLLRVALLCEGAAASPQILPIVGSRPIAHFTLRERAPLRGIVMANGKPIAGVRVRAESHNCAEAMDRFLRNAGGIRSVPVPILPVARKVVTTGSDGRFTIETSDLWLPASLVIEEKGFKRFAASVPEAMEARSLGAIELEPARAEGAFVTFASTDGRARRLRVTIAGEGGPMSQIVEVPPVGPSSPIPLAPGRYELNAKIPGADPAHVVEVRGETLLPIP